MAPSTGRTGIIPHSCFSLSDEIVEEIPMYSSGRGRDTRRATASLSASFMQGSHTQTLPSTAARWPATTAPCASSGWCGSSASTCMWRNCFCLRGLPPAAESTLFTSTTLRVLVLRHRPLPDHHWSRRSPDAPGRQGAASAAPPSFPPPPPPFVVQTQPCSAGRQDAASAALPSSPPAF